MTSSDVTFDDRSVWQGCWMVIGAYGTPNGHTVAYCDTLEEAMKHVPANGHIIQDDDYTVVKVVKDGEWRDAT